MTHFLEFHRADERRTGANAGRFLAEALNANGICVAIATPPSANAIVGEIARLGLDPVRRMQSGEFVLFDSTEMLSRFMRDDAVDAEQFDRTVGAAVRAAHRRAAGAPLHAFGDMVSVLWDRKNRDGAIALEHLWCALQRELGFSLFCTYDIDVFGPDFADESIEGILQTHTHMVASANPSRLARVLERAMDEVLGADAIAFHAAPVAKSGGSRAVMPKPEQRILWLRSNLPEFADAILERARQLYTAGGVERVFLRQEHSAK